MKEVIDVIDAHGNAIDKKGRDAVHKEGLLHRGVQVLVFNPRGELFVQQRAMGKDTYPGFWEGSLSGHVHSGESLVMAAERELHEELGVFVTPKHLMEVAQYGLNEDEERMLVTLYVLRDYKGKINTQSEEVKQGEFWPLEKVEEEMKKGELFFHPALKKALDVMKEMNINPKEFVKV